MFTKIKRNWVYIVLALLITAQAAYITYSFGALKKDFHSDEIWSYGPANSYESPFFYADLNWQDQHKNEWLSGRLLDEYLMVEEGEQFAYTQVYRNTSKDLHQPLYFWVLNTICSFFPGQFSWWYAFSINIVCFVVAQVFLFLLVRKLTKNELLALLVCFTYGFSQGAVNTYIYIRMYSMITCFGVILTYLHSVIYKEPKKLRTTLPFIWLFTFLGGMTHSFFLAFAGLLSAVFCFYYLFKRDFKSLIIYAVVQLSAAGAVFLTYPHTISHAQTYEARETTNDGYGGFWFEYRYLKMYMFRELFGINISPLTSYTGIYIMEIVLVVLAIAVPVCFLLRKEPRFCELIRKLRQTIKELPRNIATKTNWMIVMMAIVIYLLMLVVAKMAHVNSMRALSTRYVFVVNPYVYVVVLAFISWLLNLIIKKNGVIRLIKRIVLVLLSCVLIFNTMLYGGAYYFNYGNNIDFYLTELPRDANYVMALKSYWLLDCMCCYLSGTENFFASKYDEVLEQSEKLSMLESDKSVYFIIEVPEGNDVYADRESIELTGEDGRKAADLNDVNNELTVEFMKKYEEFFVENKDICDEFTYVGLSQAFGREMFVFKIR